MRRLWQVKHPYHCVGGCFFTKQPCGEDFDSWRSFLDAWGDEDEDLNLLFRWDWYEGRAHDLRRGEARVELHYFMQRQGRPHTCRVDVTRVDEPAVRSFLKKKWRYMQRLWMPLQEAA